jgi:two-component system, NtrC family, sensor kinase
LLDYGRKSSPQMSASDVNHIMDEVLGGVKEREFAVKSIDIVRNYSPDLPEIMVDPDQIKQVFVNLVNNAGDAISGPGKITVSTSSNGDKARITIVDTGQGMASNKIKKIFDPFYTTKEIGKGTGLGLSVSLGIVESMGGTIEVQSIPGRGSAFTVSLPIITEKERK